CFVFGQSGMLERSRFAGERTLLLEELDSLQRENRRLKLVRSEHASGKLTASECESAGYVRPGDRILFFTSGNNAADISHEKNSSAKIFAIETLRIAWISFSALAFFLYIIIIRKIKRRGDQNISAPEDY
ncbi:MAG: hypothetical protein ACRCUT_04305, partial [Spirochaetota bacterium]